MANYEYFEPPIAAGGDKVVYRGRCVETGLDVVVKILRAPYGPIEVQRFAKEIQRAAAGAGTGIAQILDHNLSWAPPFLVEEYYPDGTLAERMRRTFMERKVFRVRFALGWCRQVLVQLAGLHGRNIVHRDVKPANVLMKGDDIVLGDLGIGRTLNRPSALQTQAFVGTPAYAAPEQALLGVNVDHRADLYAVGVVLHELLTGTRGAFNVMTYGEDAMVALFLRSLLAFDPARRPQTALHALAFIDQVLPRVA